MAKGLSKGQVKNFLLPHVGIGDNPDSAARLSCALFAVYAGCGKRIIETYCSLEMLLMMDLVEKAGTRYRLTALARERLEIEDKKEPNPYFTKAIQDRLIGYYGRTLKERAEINWDPIPTWTEEDWKRGRQAIKHMIQIALASPHLKKDDSPERVARYVEQIIRAMVYSDGRDYYYYNDQGWDIWTLARSFRKHVFRMRSLQTRKESEKPAETGRQKL